MRVKVQLTLLNSKGAPYKSNGYFWDDGTIFAYNPYKKINQQHYGLTGTTKSKKLWWCNSKLEIIEESQLTLGSMMLKPGKKACSKT